MSEDVDVDYGDLPDLVECPGCSADVAPGRSCHTCTVIYQDGAPR